jgi:hypothetical protein
VAGDGADQPGADGPVDVEGLAKDVKVPPKVAAADWKARRSIGSTTS